MVQDINKSSLVVYQGTTVDTFPVERGGRTLGYDGQKKPSENDWTRLACPQLLACSSIHVKHFQHLLHLTWAEREWCQLHI